jgi:UDP-2,3-diacylglucosamine pyrophosphatase LpxH
MKKILFFMTFFLSMNCFGMECPEISPPPGHRLVVAISDLHFGLGHKANGDWEETEDFRWGSALEAFLDRLKSCGNGPVDLVIAGDSMELWQPPASIKCQGPNADFGCSESEYIKILEIVLAQHKDDLAIIGKFADYSDNRVYFVPGNHDAVLLLDSAWKMVKGVMTSQEGRVVRCGISAAPPCSKNGWISGQGAVFIEHGHQIGADVNKFPDWPTITKDFGPDKYVVRPWGQLFVQKLFNEQERNYPIIDNLMPESAGVKYRMADQRIWGTAKDVAAFIRFNLFETSHAQKIDELGSPGSDNKVWDVNMARKGGYKLFMNALPKGDEFRKTIEGDTVEAKSVRQELDSLAITIDNDEIRALCASIAVVDVNKSCDGGELNAIAQSALRSKKGVLGAHLSMRTEKEAPKMKIFIYAHTHEYEQAWKVPVKMHSDVTVLNTGAFQRLVSEEQFLNIAKSRGMAPKEALSKLSVSDLNPCYAAVFAFDDGEKSAAKTVRWYIPDNGKGQFVTTQDALCK